MVEGGGEGENYHAVSEQREVKGNHQHLYTESLFLVFAIMLLLLKFEAAALVTVLLAIDRTQALPTAICSSIQSATTSHRARDRIESGSNKPISRSQEVPSELRHLHTHSLEDINCPSSQ